MKCLLILMVVAVLAQTRSTFDQNDHSGIVADALKKTPTAAHGVDTSNVELLPLNKHKYDSPESRLLRLREQRAKHQDAMDRYIDDLDNPAM